MLRHSMLRFTALVCVVLVGSLLSPGRAAAEPPIAKPASVREAAKVVAERHAGSMKASRSTQTTNSQPNLESGSFFKSPIGVAVLVAFAAGTGYAIYSSTNDRIKGSGR